MNDRFLCVVAIIQKHRRLSLRRRRGHRAHQWLKFVGNSVKRSVNTLKRRDGTAKVSYFVVFKVIRQVRIETLSTVEQEVIAFSEVYIHSNVRKSCKKVCFECVYCVMNLRNEVEWFCETLSKSKARTLHFC